jgi:hypothetical protein
MKKISLLTVLLMIGGCNKSPFDRTRDASNGGALENFGVTSAFRIFSDELVTGGGAFEYPGGENQTLSFSDTSNPVSHRSIRYSWNGEPPAIGGTDHTFAGFSLIQSASQSTYLSTPGRNLSAANYGRATFFIRGSLSTNTRLKIEVADDGDSLTPGAGCMTLSGSGTVYNSGTNDICSNGATGTLNGDWQRVTVTIPSGALSSVRDFIKTTFVYSDPLPGVPGQAPGQGGVVYLDQIQYEP